MKRKLHVDDLSKFWLFKAIFWQIYGLDRKWETVVLTVKVTMTVWSSMAFKLQPNTQCRNSLLEMWNVFSSSGDKKL